MKPTLTEVRVRHPKEAIPVKIVADAAISTRGLHGGRLLPLLLLDTSERPDISALISAHHAVHELGDVKTQWGTLPIEGHEGFVALFLTFIRPAELFMILEFEIVRQSILVEQILRGRGLYISEATDENDRFKRNPERPKIIIEVPETGYDDMWNETFHKHLVKDYRERGLTRGDARRAAHSAIEELRKFNSLRLRDLHE